MLSWTNEIVDSGMGYQKFSVHPFMALNDASGKRLSQLSSDLSFVTGLSVLDIGIYAGLASITCLDLGAKSVTGTDVDDTFFKHIYKRAARTNKPLTLEKVDFLNLTNKHISDVVIFLEVYHWLSHQGINYCEVAKKLNSIALRFIYIETPWDKTDPSVSKYSKTLNYYYPAKLLDALVNYGWSVQFMGLCDYFEVEYHRARFLLTKKS